MSAALNIVETKNEGLVREFDVTVPAALYAQSVQGRLQQLAQKVKVPGFRPGKVPLAMVEKRYGNQARTEALEAVLKATVNQALNEKQVRAIQQPKIDLKVFEDGKDITYAIKMEVLPEIPDIDPASLTLNRPSCPVTDADVDAAVAAELADYRYFDDTAKTYKAKKGDLLRIDYVATLDGADFPDNRQTNYVLEIGEDATMQGMNDGLTGVKNGEEKTFPVTFATEGIREDLAGKTVEMRVTVHEVRKAVKVKTVDEMIAQINKEEDEQYAKEKASAADAGQADNQADDQPEPLTLEAYRDGLRKREERRRQAQVNEIVRTRLLDALDATIQFDLPPSLLDQEIRHVAHVDHDHGPGEACSHTLSDEEKQRHTAIASRRVKLGLLLADCGRKNSIRVDDEAVRMEIHRIAWRSGEYPRVLEYFRDNPSAIETVKGSLYENAVIDFILEKAAFTDEDVTAEDLKNLQQKLGE